MAYRVKMTKVWMFLRLMRTKNGREILKEIWKLSWEMAKKDLGR